MIKPYLYKWTKLNAKLNSLTCLNFITRIPNTVDTDTDVGTAEAISKIIALHATYKARVFKVEEKVFKSQIAHVCNCTEDDFDLNDWKTIQCPRIKLAGQ